MKQVGDVYNVLNNGTITLPITVNVSCDIDKVKDDTGSVINGKNLVYIYDNTITNAIEIGDVLTIGGINVTVESITLSSSGVGTYRVNVGSSTLSNGTLTKITYILNLDTSDNICWTGYRWDKLASSINLNPY